MFFQKYIFFSKYGRLVTFFTNLFSRSGRSHTKQISDRTAYCLLPIAYSPYCESVNLKAMPPLVLEVRYWFET